MIKVQVTEAGSYGFEGFFEDDNGNEIPVDGSFVVENHEGQVTPVVTSIYSVDKEMDLDDFDVEDIENQIMLDHHNLNWHTDLIECYAEDTYSFLKDEGLL